MKITRRQLRKIIREASEETGHAAFVKAFDAAYKQPDGSYRGHPDDPEDYRDELATQIRNATGDLYNSKNMYDFEGMSTEELEDLLSDISNSPDSREAEVRYRDEDEDAMGRDSDLSAAEMAPKSQGFSRRPAGSKSQRRMESAIKTRKILRRKIRSLLKNL